MKNACLWLMVSILFSAVTARAQGPRTEGKYSVTPKCVCLPAEEDLAVDESQAIPGQSSTNSFPNREAALRACATERATRVKSCRKAVYGRLVAQVRGACKEYSKLDPACVDRNPDEDPCKPVDSDGFPGLSQIAVTGASCTAVAAQERWRWQITPGSCRFQGTIFILCDP